MTSRTRHACLLACAASLLLGGLATAPASADGAPAASAAPTGPVAGPPGRLSGAAFTDADGDGRLGPGDTVAPDGDLVVASRVDADGTREGGDLVTTVEQGRWSLSGLTAGTWLVYQTRPGQTLPAAQQPYRLTIGAGDAEPRGWEDVDFGVDPAAVTPTDATLRGAVVDAHGHGLAGVVVSDRTDGTSTTTGSDGSWTLTAVSYGVHLVDHDEQDHARTPPAHEALLVAGGAEPGSRTFTVAAPGRAEVSGTVFDDLDGDGVRDDGEAALPGADLGLVGTATAGTWDAEADATGAFTVGELPADSLGVTAPAGWRVTTGPLVVPTYTSSVRDVAVGLHRPRTVEPTPPTTPAPPAPTPPTLPAPPTAVVTLPAKPGAPARLRAKARAGGVVLRWAAPAGPEPTDYLVEVRRPGTKRWTTLPALDAATTRLTMTALAPGRWWFRVAAVSADGTGALSRPVGVVVRR